MKPKIRFSIYLNDDIDNKRVVNPNYKDDVSTEIELETNQRFYRNKFSGKITFMNKPTNDFDFLMNQPFDTQYNLLTEISNDYGQTWETEFKGKFFQTDATINFDDKTFEVQPDAVDDYTKVLAGLDKEYNLSDLGLEINAINLQKRPLIQVYFPGDEIVSCFLSGMTWEQDVTESTTDVNKITQQYKFSFSTVVRTLMVEIDGTPLDVAGLYTTKTSGAAPFTGTLQGGNGYRADVIAQLQPGTNTFATSIQIYRNSDNAFMFFGFINNMNGLNDGTVMILQAQGTATGQARATFNTKPIYMRYVLDQPSINGVGTYPIADDDLVENNRNYRYCIGYAIDSILVSNNLSDEPTKWGKNTAGKYFLEPYSLFGQKFYPVARSQWENQSYWFAFHYADEMLEKKGRSAAVLKDSYPIHSVISELLKEFAPEIIHEPTPEFSEFLYGDTNPIYYKKFRLAISQKTNLLNLQYQNPAQKTEMTLQDVLNMLRDCFRCFWYIEDSKLKIEHVEWFRNGGRYTGTPNIAYDLTTLINIRNGKNWGYNMNQITFDKMDMPERFQFKWMDDVSSTFEGMPIEVLSRYVMPGKIEEINVSKFNSDIDYLLLNPSEISQDGFALMATVNADAFYEVEYGGRPYYALNDFSAQRYPVKPESWSKNAKMRMTAFLESGTGSGEFYVAYFDVNNGFLGGSTSYIADGTEKIIPLILPPNTAKVGVDAIGNVNGELIELLLDDVFELPFVNQTVNGVNSSLQNGILAFSVLQPNFYIYDLPAKLVKINGEEMTVQTDRKRKQNAEFPIEERINPQNLINTDLGLGQIDKITLNLHSRMTKTTLKYDTEQ